MAVTLTENAANEIKRILTDGKMPDGTMVRVGVKGGGCSGLDYDFRLDNQYDEKADSKFDCHGVTVVVDKKSALHIDGTIVDFYNGLDKRGFQFNNPMAVKTCGCGHSFST